MSKDHYRLQYPAETFGGEVMRIVDPFGESERSKSQEHEGRLSINEKTQKITENEENKS